MKTLFFEKNSRGTIMATFIVLFSKSAQMFEQ